MTQTINQLGLNLIMSFEGFSPNVYQDSGGVWTIGYGHTDGVTADTPPITQEQAAAYLQTDLANAEADVSDTITVPLSDNQFAALVSITYNVGTGPINGTLGTLLNQGDYQAAAEQFERWIYADGKIIPGLIRRRTAEKQLFLSQ